MYNGIESISVKGTGLSGYVQRSKAAVSQIAKFTPIEYTDEIPPPAINPLEALRAANENKELASRLEQHKALRAIKLQILLYREERLEKGISIDVVNRECRTLQESLIRNYREEEKVIKREEAMEAAQKTAERFAAAFGVKQGIVGESFDRAQREAERKLAEEQKRKAMEDKISERVKRVKGE